MVTGPRVELPNTQAEMIYVLMKSADCAVCYLGHKLVRFPYSEGRKIMNQTH
jgi:hypothetical protein